MKANYHTHTSRCNHAVGKDEEYVKAAIEMGFEEIGFTDHSPWPLHPFEMGRIRMKLEELEGYVSSVRSLQEKYKDQITIYLGLEAEFFEDRIDWLEETVKKYDMDYLVFGNHFYRFDVYNRYFGHYDNRETVLQDYLDHAVKGMRTGLYRIFAHPDLWMRGYYPWDDECEAITREICKVAKETGIYLEYNLGGVRDRVFHSSGYPDEHFWKIVAEEGCPSVIGIDAHSPQDFYDETLFIEAETYLKKIGVNLEDKIQIKEEL